MSPKQTKMAILGQIMNQMSDHTNLQRIVLIGAGIMSATLGIFIHRLFPDAQIQIYERLDRVGAESSDAWNNAGTGHSAFCELNYTPLREDGSVDITKALKIGEAFEVSKQLWAYLVKTGRLTPEKPFINDIDHMSFVMGEENVAFLQKRYAAMQSYPMFADMFYEDDHATIKDFIPLLMEGRPASDTLATTRMAIGTDVNFGEITRGMISYLASQDNVELHLGHEVRSITRVKEGWMIEAMDLSRGYQNTVIADFLFNGAGGGALKLLEMADIDEAKGYGGFPVSGQWLRCTNPDVINRHEAKVYGKAATGNPPMSVPHLDTRMMNGERSLLFGPYAGFSTKFLKNGSLLDLPLSIEMHNIWPMLSAGIHNIGLTKYLIEQVMQSPEERFAMLQVYYPEAVMEDWELLVAGQRVQIIKKDKEEGGVLKFGTEIVSVPDGTMAALLGASPGASTAVSIMLDVLSLCFPDQMKSDEWISSLQEMIPSYGKSLIEDGELLRHTRSYTTEVLQLAE